MTTTIFFSWQADRSTTEGRNLIERALERAVARIGQDTSIEEPIRDVTLDKDTKGVPGSPPIVDTIFRKIDSAAVFVPDLTFVGTRVNGRLTPNPNVLIEYGWALKALGHHRIVPVMNVAHGEPNKDNMPFNMQHLRYPALLYNCPDGADEEQRKAAREDLGKRLEKELRKVLESEEYQAVLPKPTPPPPFIPRQAKDGQGRYRARGEALGVTHDRLAILTKTPLGEVHLVNNPVIWLRVMPALKPDREWLVTELERAGTHVTQMLSPMSDWCGLSYMRAKDGWGTYESGRSDQTMAAVMAFTSGEIWAIDAYLLNAGTQDNKRILYPLEKMLCPALANYVGFLERLGVKPPYHWIAGVEDTKGRGMQLPSQISPRGPCLVEVVTESGEFVEGDTPEKALEPFFAKLYDACGVAMSAPR